MYWLHVVQDLVKYTTDVGEHLELSKLLESVRKTNEHLNESKKKRDNAAKLAQIQNNLVFAKGKASVSFFLFKDLFTVAHVMASCTSMYIQAI